MKWFTLFWSMVSFIVGAFCGGAMMFDSIGFIRGDEDDPTIVEYKNKLYRMVPMDDNERGNK